MSNRLRNKMRNKLQLMNNEEDYKEKMERTIKMLYIIISITTYEFM